MRVLLTSTASYAPPRGGSTRSNRVWLEYLASRGHVCHVLCGTPPVANEAQLERVVREAAIQGFSVDQTQGESEITLANGIHVTSCRDLARQKGMIARHIREFRPDWILVSSEDLGHSLLREADETAPGQIVYLSHTPQFLPFGPESWSPDSHASARVRNAAAVVVIGNHMSEYIQQHLGRCASVIHPAIYGDGPFETYAGSDRGFVLMVNPCAVKGLSIFAAISRAMPKTEFSALSGWGTNSEDRGELDALPQMTVLEPVHRIEQILRQTRVLIMPSLWHEGFGLIAMEAMLRGIPVIASNSGGLVEAKRGTGFVLPVSPILEYLPVFDEVHMPRPVVPAQDVGPWIDALEELLRDPAVYAHESARSREVALGFVNGLKPSAIEDLLLSLTPRKTAALGERFNGLSPAQRATLAAKVRRSRAAP